MSLNRIDLMGRLTRDPEVRYTNNQKPVANFAIAVDRYGKDAKTDFIEIVAWNGTATFVQNYFHKGDPIVISGRLQMKDWTDKNGNKRTSAEVVADEIYFVPKTKQSEDGIAEPDDIRAEPDDIRAEYSPMSEADGELPF